MDSYGLASFLKCNFLFNQFSHERSVRCNQDHKCSLKLKFCLKSGEHSINSIRIWKKWKYRWLTSFHKNQFVAEKFGNRKNRNIYQKLFLLMDQFNNWNITSLFAKFYFPLITKLGHKCSSYVIWSVWISDSETPCPTQDLTHGQFTVGCTYSMNSLVLNYVVWM